MSSRFAGAPFCELDPAGTDQAISIFGRHLDSDHHYCRLRYPDLAHNDEVDACSGALEMLNPNMNSWGAYELARQRHEELQAERGAASGRAEPTLAPGSMEWLAQQKNPS